MRSYQLQITTPAGVLFEGDATQLSVKAVDGELAIMAGHVPITTALKAGECRVYLDDGTVRHGECSGGMLSVKKEKVSLLSSDFRWKE